MSGLSSKLSNPIILSFINFCHQHSHNQQQAGSTEQYQGLYIPICCCRAIGIGAVVLHTVLTDWSGLPVPGLVLGGGCCFAAICRLGGCCCRGCISVGSIGGLSFVWLLRGCCGCLSACLWIGACCLICPLTGWCYPVFVHPIAHTAAQSGNIQTAAIE